MQPHTGKRKRAPPPPPPPPRSQKDTTNETATWNQILKNGQPPNPSGLGFPPQLMNQNHLSQQAAAFQPTNPNPAAVRSTPAAQQQRVATPVFPGRGRGRGRPRPRTPPFPFANCTVGLDPATLPSKPDPIAVAEIKRVICPEPPRRPDGTINLPEMVKMLETDGMGAHGGPPARRKQALDKQQYGQIDGAGAQTDLTKGQVAEDMSGADFDALFRNLAEFEMGGTSFD
ncbi:hypothetical protein LTR47_004013 [Exophiala xenobiotica]|nr:hypothetical protein LTR47_004013 [Exophiala xenobiotica]